jgi:hypothetical protein
MFSPQSVGLIPGQSRHFHHRHHRG